MELLTPHAGEARFEQVNVTPDGAWAVSCDRRGRRFSPPGLPRPHDAHELQTFDTIAWDVDAVTLSPDGRVLAIVTNEDGYSRWSLRNLQEGRELPAPELPPGVCGLLAFAPDSQAIAFTLSGPQHPDDIWVYDLRSATTRRATNSSLAGIPRASFVTPELVHYPTFDHRAIPAYLYRPHCRCGRPICR